MADQIVPPMRREATRENRRTGRCPCLSRRRRWQLAALAAATLTCSTIAVAMDCTSDNPRRDRGERSSSPPVDPPSHKHQIFYPATAMAAPAAEAISDDTPDALLERFMHLHSTMQYDAALRIAEQLATMRPDSALALYNLACIQARLHMVDQAIATLERAIDSGWRRLTHLQLDPDLQCLRGDDRHAAIVAALESRLSAEESPAASRRDEPWSEIAGELERRVPVWLREYEVPGVSIALLRGGSVVWDAGIGRACTVSGEAMTAETRFPVRGPATLATLIAALHSNHDAERQLAALIDLADQPVADSPRRSTRLTAARRESSARRFAAPPRRDVGRPANHQPYGREHVDDARAPVSSAPPEHSASRSAELLHLLVELSSGQSTRAYCQSEIFAPGALTATSFPQPGIDPGLAIGHTALGTPITEMDECMDRGVLHSTAPDLARLVAQAAMISPANDSDGPATQRALATRVISMIRSGSVLPRRVIRTPGGLRYELSEDENGRGCLIQWHPHGGDGIVVLYNAAHGAALARHIARHALGGERRHGS